MIMTMRDQQENLKEDIRSQKKHIEELQDKELNY